MAVLRWISTTVLTLSVLATGCYVMLGIEFAAGSAAITVLSWWWTNGDGQAAVLFFACGFVVFALLLAQWGITWFQIALGKPAQFVWLGPGLKTDTDYYYLLDDPDRRRFLLKSRPLEYANRSASNLFSLFTLLDMLRIGSDPSDAVRVINCNTRSQCLLVFFQHLALSFGLIALSQVLHQYIEHQGHALTAALLPTSAIIALLPLAFFHLAGLISGHIRLRRLSDSFPSSAPMDTPKLDLRPGDRLSVTLVEQSRERDSSGNKPFKSFYRVEWSFEPGLVVSAVIAFRATWKVRKEIDELDRMTKRRRDIECLVANDGKLHPMLLRDAAPIDWL